MRSNDLLTSFPIWFASFPCRLAPTPRSQVPRRPTHVLSRPSGCILKPVPSIIPMADGGSSLLSSKKKDLIWYVNQLRIMLNFLFILENPAKFGACIPQCLNGTNLLIPLARRIDPEHFAVTRKSARLDAQESTYLPLLYDFEELEGELNFLNRVIALSFHPSATGRIPITLGEGKDLEFEQLMKLEIRRLHRDLFTAERDTALLSIYVIPATIDPNRLVDYSDLLKLCN